MSVAQRLRRGAGAVRGAFRRGRDRMLHPLRQARTRDRLRRTGRPRHILVVCHGNICRSPYLASVLQRLLADVHVSSAGLVGPDRPVPDPGVAVASRRGVELGAHRSRVLTRDLVSGSDLAIVMEAGQARALVRQGMDVQRIVVAGDLDPMSSNQRSIEDPWGQQAEAFEASYDRLDRCARVLAEWLH